MGCRCRARPPNSSAGSARTCSTGWATVRTREGADVNAYFLEGARQALEQARSCGARIAILKDGSPSCGSLRVFDGTFGGWCPARG